MKNTHRTTDVGYYWYNIPGTDVVQQETDHDFRAFRSQPAAIICCAGSVYLVEVQPRKCVLDHAD